MAKEMQLALNSSAEDQFDFGKNVFEMLWLF